MTNHPIYTPTKYGMGLWGRSYLGVGRRGASRARQSTLSKGRGETYRGENLPWKNTHMGLPEGNQSIWTPSPVQGLTGDPGELTPVLDLASGCSTQSDCRGCWRNSTRVCHPENFLEEEKRHSHPRVRGNGAASMTSPSSSHHLLFTQHMGIKWLNTENVEST